MRSKSHLEISPFNWECKLCGQHIAVVDDFYDEESILKHFRDYINIYDLENIPLLKRNYQAQEVLAKITEGESVGLFCEIDGHCTNTKCEMEYALTFWILVELERKDGDNRLFSVIDLILVDGNFIKISSNPGFYRGLDIARGLNNLYLRWWYLKGEIYVICPFIGLEELGYFDIIGRQILKTNSCLLKESFHKNPFKRIITRKNTSYYEDVNGKTFRKKITIAGLIDKYLTAIEPNKIFLDREKGSGLQYIMDGPLYGVENIPRKEMQDHHKYANYFHGKLYGSNFADSSEIVITSYNYTVAETLQLESLSFIESTKDNLNRQIEIFENDQHMTIKSIDL